MAKRAVDALPSLLELKLGDHKSKDFPEKDVKWGRSIQWIDVVDARARKLYQPPNGGAVNGQRDTNSASEGGSRGESDGKQNGEVQQDALHPPSITSASGSQQYNNRGAGPWRNFGAGDVRGILETETYEETRVRDMVGVGIEAKIEISTRHWNDFKLFSPFHYFPPTKPQDPQLDTFHDNRESLCLHFRPWEQCQRGFRLVGAEAKVVGVEDEAEEEALGEKERDRLEWIPSLLADLQQPLLSSPLVSSHKRKITSVRHNLSTCGERRIPTITRKISSDTTSHELQQLVTFVYGYILLARHDLRV
ncbi:hypothetical protein DL98DRAFT_658528 [Cadophora sp. DSE1049]|nr:hypothetical protein DL98DRAFT_658528 [Cadophora sp. DSE1049]